MKNDNPTYSKTSQSTRIEWWAYVSFVIDQTGAPSDIEFINISGKAKISDRSKVVARIKRLKYSPAIYKGMPVLSNKKLLYKQDISFYGSTNDGISVGFKNNYNITDSLITSDKLKEAKEALVTLEDSYGKNLIEQSLTAWLKSVYYYKVSAWEEYGAEVEKAFLLKEFLPKKMKIKVINNVTNYRIFKKQYSSALASAAEFEKLQGISNGKEAFQAYYDRILANLVEQTKIVSTYVLKANDLSHYILLNKKDIKLTNNSDAIYKLQLRCLTGERTLKIKSEVSFSLSEDDKECALIVHGKEGGDFSILEKGNNILK